uniref:PPM-type phosphatase domain-containing protein n=1 Tax=Kalanchoe fedtschenkoi TaxID=63787 RepID=A0A7N0ZRV3_KALFE
MYIEWDFMFVVGFTTEQGGLSAEVIRKAFDATEEEFLDFVKESWSERPEIASVGSCCLVGAISKGVLYVANLGDSRAVLGRRVSQGKNSTVVAERLSTDHNVAVEEVRKEVEALHPDDSHVVVFTRGVWRIKGIIQVSRSIGDVYLKKPEYNKSPLLRQIAPFFPLKKAVMTAEPSILIRKLRPQDLFVIFASDGLWEQLSDEDAVSIVLRSPRAGVAKRLVRAALQEAARKREIKYDDIKRIERGFRRHIHDDITVIVMYLDHPQGPPSNAIRPSNNKGFVDYTSAPMDIFSFNSEDGGEMSFVSP